MKEVGKKDNQQEQVKSTKLRRLHGVLPSAKPLCAPVTPIIKTEAIMFLRTCWISPSHCVQLSIPSAPN